MRSQHDVTHYGGCSSPRCREGMQSDPHGPRVCLCAGKAHWEGTEGASLRRRVPHAGSWLLAEGWQRGPLAGLGACAASGPHTQRGSGSGVGLGICIFNKHHLGTLRLWPVLAYLCPWAAAWLKEFISPWGVVEIPFLYMVPIRGSAPRSNSKLTSSKLPAGPEKGFHKGIKQRHSHRHIEGQGGGDLWPGREPASLTYGGCELQGRFRVVLLAVLHGAFHLGPGVQQELWRKTAVDTFKARAR